MSVALVNAGETDCTPWSVLDSAPVIGNQNPPPETDIKGRTGILGSFCHAWLTLYQKFLSRLSMAHCPMHPSCSNFSRQAIAKHGPVWGVVLTADRLIHERGEADYVPLIHNGDRLLFYDPVENNDFWW